MSLEKRNKIMNKGAALISVLIAVTFITILATSILVITVNNYQMKVANAYSKNNYYEVEGNLTVLSASLRNESGGKAAFSTGKLETAVGAPIGSMTVDSGVTSRNFTVSNAALCKLVYPSATTNSYKDGDDTFTFTSSGNGNITFDSSTKLYTVKIQNVAITQKSIDGYENSAQTDIIFKVKESSVPASTGGIGEFSMLLDDGIETSSNVSVVTVYGNSYFSSYSYNSSLAKTTPGDTSNPAMLLTNEAKINVVGDYMIIYGDVMLKDNSCLNVAGGNLCVYGDIYIYGNAKLICDGTLYQVKEAMPGRTLASSIYFVDASNTKTEFSVASDDLKKTHIFPYNLTTQALGLSNYNEFADLLNLNDSDANNDGVSSKIMKAYTKDGKKYDFNSFTANINGSKTFSHSVYGDTVNVNFYNGNGTIMFNDTKDNYAKRLILSPAPTMINKTHLNATFISRGKIQISEVHSVQVSKLGPENFDYLISTNNTTKFDLQTSDGDVKDMSIPAIFDEHCNDTVNQMIGSATGSAGKKTYTTAVRLENFVKDK